MGKSSSHKSGFTLIELSIVLVIIGLIVGGILTGQSLIYQAQIRGTISAMDKYKQAYNAFVNKYNCVPGDCANATSVIGGINIISDNCGNSTPNGNGNGLIYSYSDASGESLCESWYAFDVLHAAGMIAESFPYRVNNVNNIPIPNGFMFFTSMRPNASPAGFSYPDKDTNYLYISIQPNNSQYWNVANPVLTPSQAYAIDLKIDDGMPMSGNVRASWTNQHSCQNGSSSGEGPCFGSPAMRSGHPASATCVDDSVTPNVYWLAPPSNLLQNIYSLCSIHVPVN